MVIHSEEEGLIFRTSDHTPDVINQVLLERGWSQYDETKLSKSEGSWNLWWKTQRFRKSEHDEIAPWQRLNHFPRTDAITRKDCLVRNLRRMRCVHGLPLFNFHPMSYVLPNEYTKFVTDYSKDKQKSDKKNVYWICKPADLSRGRGIFVFHDLKDLSYDCSVVVQRYITNPFLISGYKFDLRIYVCVPSFQPLTIYMYQEGIVRFSTDKFDLNQLKNVFSHLTNTSINKYGPSYSVDKERLGPGCKWTLSQLRSYLRQMDAIDELLLWYRISNIVTCTLATQAPTVPKSRNCFEVFGFDILVDDQMKPWLLEVNFSPALSMDCQADFIAKRSMINDLIDLLNFKDDDRDHGGETFRSCPTPSGHGRSTYTRASTGRAIGSKSKHLSSSKSFMSLSNPPDRPKERVPASKSFTSLPVRSSVAKNNDRRRSDGKGSRKKDFLHHPPSHEVCDEFIDIESGDQLPGDNSFPRNFSSNSVTSSVSSVDQSNQPDPDDLPADVISKKSPPKVVDDDEQVKSAAPGRKVLNTSMSLTLIKEGPNPVAPSSRTKSPKVNRLDATLSFPKRSASPKLLKKKKPLHSTCETLKPRYVTSASSKWNKTKQKSAGSYQSPYSIASTGGRATNSAQPWPRTRVGDFVLTFPLNDAMRKASGANFDMKTILKEQQKILKKLASISNRQWDSSRSDSISFTADEALQLSFQLKFDEKDRNPLYFWGPQNPPLLSRILS